MARSSRTAAAAMLVFVSGLVVAGAPRGQVDAASPRQMALGISSLPDTALSNVDDHTQSYGRAPALRSIWNYWFTPSPTDIANGLRDRGIVPFVWWLPVNTDGSTISWSDVVAGNADAYGP